MQLENEDPDEITFEEEELDETAFNLPLDGSPLYPRVFFGDSTKPLNGQFDESEYIDDNISRTWTGLLTSIYG